MQTYNKAIVALVVPAILTGLNHLGVTPDMPVSEVVEMGVMTLITAIAVWFVPNKNV